MAATKKTTEEKKGYPSTLVEAVLNVMEDCKGVDKSMTVGSGSNSYRGVSDKDVKLIVSESMRKNGLIILPIEVKPVLEVNRWEEEQTWNGKVSLKQKQSAFVEVTTRYKLKHVSGEEEILEGYGHGVDSQDKAAGKATTYALKYTLLYTFLVATGHIDDADNTHSDDVPTPKPQPKPTNTKAATSKEDQFVAYIIKQGGLTDALKEQIKKASSTWDANTIKSLVKKSGVKTIKDEDIDGILK